MILNALRPTLSSTTRWPGLSRDDAAAAAEWALLLGLGAVATCCGAFLELGLRIPGHAILYSVLPTAAGLALVPRRGAALVVSAGALVTAGVLRLAHVGELPIAAIVGLASLGPALELAAAKSRPGPTFYAAFAVAGAAANLVVYGVRWLTFFAAGEVVSAKPFAQLGWRGAASFVACGLVAGLLGAALGFRSRPRETQDR